MPFVGDYPGGYASVDVGLFKDSLSLGKLPLPLPDVEHVDPINIISYGVAMPISPIELSYSVIQSVSFDPDLGVP